MSSLEIVYIVTIWNGSEGVIVEKRHVGPEWIYTVNIFDHTTYRDFYEFELSETDANKRDRKLKEIGI
jgi:hypothetical protein